MRFHNAPAHQHGEFDDLLFKAADGVENDERFAGSDAVTNRVSSARRACAQAGNSLSVQVILVPGCSALLRGPGSVHSTFA